MNSKVTTLLRIGQEQEVILSKIKTEVHVQPSYFNMDNGFLPFCPGPDPCTSNIGKGNVKRAVKKKGIS